MFKLDIRKETRDKIKAELKMLYEQGINAGLGTEGEIENKKVSLENKLDKIEQEIKSLEEAQFPNQLNIKIFVITNYIDNIQLYVPEDIFCKIPSDRNSNDKIEDWIPYYDSKKTIKRLLEEFKETEKYKFSVVYLNGHNNQCDFEVMIDDSIKEGYAIGIIDLLGINTINRPIAKRFDTQIVKSTILPICRKLPSEVQDFMIENQKSLFSLSNYKFKNELCCFFSKTSGGDELIQHLRHIYSSNWKIKNQISDLGDDNNDYRNLNLGLS